MKRLTRFALAAVAAALVLPVAAAWAGFTSSSSNTGNSAVMQIMRQGNTPTKTISGRDVTISWTAAKLSDGSTSPSSYTIARSGGSGTPSTSGCNGSVAGLTCTDAGMPVTSTAWSYTDTPVLSSWTGATSSALSFSVPDPAASLDTTSFTTSGGSATVTVSNFFDNESITLCLDTASGTCASGNNLGSVTIPATGGTNTKAVTIPSGLSAGTHSVYAWGSVIPVANRPAATFTVANPLAISSVVRDGGNKKVHFTGTGGAAGSLLTVTICTVNSFPCASGNIAGTATVTPASAGSWTSGQDSTNLGGSVNYWAQAVQGSSTSAVFAFSTGGL